MRNIAMGAPVDLINDLKSNKAVGRSDAGLGDAAQPKSQ